MIKKTMLTASIFLCSINLASADEHGGSPYDHLQINDSALFTSITGDGHEEGVKISIKDYTKTEAGLEVMIPGVDNRASCLLTSVKTEKVEKLFENSNYSSYYYTATISTRIEGDTGSCLIWIKSKESGETLKIVQYSYITDF